MELQQPGMFVNRDRKVHILANTITKILGDNRIRANNHEVCAGHEAAIPIARTTQQPSTEVFERAKVYMPGIIEAHYERATEATGRILGRNLIADPAESTIAMKADFPEYPKIPFAKLVPTEHAAVAYLAIHQKRRVLNVEKAAEHGLGMYSTNMGDLEEVHALVYPYIPVNLDYLRTAVAMRHADIGQHHLLGADGRPLPLVAVAEAA
jgi:hypothetical protein